MECGITHKIEVHDPRCVITSDSSALPCRHVLRGEKGTELIPLRIGHDRPA